jgi:hypothetical protein
LIAPEYVLVAAHSVVGLPPGQLTFTIGGTKYRIADVFVHPDYEPDAAGTDFGNDIAILKLNQAVSGITPSVLSGRSPRLGETLKLVGFGEQDGAPYGTKRVGSTPMIDDLGTTIFRWTHESEVQNDSDPGDSGSPLFLNVGGVDQVVGIVSGGTSNFDGVGDTATNTRVDVYLDWIKSIVSTIQVTDVADAPSLMLDESEVFFDENSGVHRVGLLASDAGSLSFTVSTDSPTLFQNLSVDSDGSRNGNIEFEFGLNQRGTAKVFVTAHSSNGLSTTQTLTVTVEERNDRPTIDPVPIQGLDVSAAAQQTINLTGITAGLGETGSVQVNLVSATPFNFFSSVAIVPPTGARSVGSTATLKYTPTTGVVGRGTIAVEVRDSGPDGVFNTSDDGIMIQLVDIFTTTNRAPTMEAISNTRIKNKQEVFSIPLAGITDGDTSDTNTQPLQFSVVSSNPEVVDYTIEYDNVANGSSGTLKVAPRATGTTSLTVNVSDPGDDNLFGTFDDRTSARTFTLIVANAVNNWFNDSAPYDVNADGFVSPLDLLIVINYLNSNGVGTFDESKIQFVAPFIDTNDDGSYAPIDALVVINELNRLSRLNSLASGEGEDSPATQSDSTMAAAPPFDAKTALTESQAEGEDEDWPDSTTFFEAIESSNPVNQANEFFLEPNSVSTVSVKSRLRKSTNTFEATESLETCAVDLALTDYFDESA